ncbi:NACHT domain-containing protein [Streptomyces hiroshimensis]|uniref:NACHT domain-containing protein n=1 Tax=Streptomyces hiroshimensis TaxID=66424 RepID=A0ABQ2Z6U7_9ACTN|nr:NACHT domain-containing protein [Streptomyces hiroshimensis]GGY05197.1 hypothetical protein GCM10010324_59950 [Streptomyces hiroshimensis]
MPDLPQWIPWLGGAVLAVVGATAKSWLETKLKQAADFLYARLAGSPLLRRTALAKYVRELHARHSKFAVSFQVEDALKLPMESVYVPLRAAGAAPRAPGEMAATLRQERRSVVLGVPGAGKTMLLRHEALMWAKGRLRPGRRGRGRPRVDLAELTGVPVLLELHRLNKNPEWSLEQHIADHFGRHEFPRAEKWVARALERGDLALYFDGLDEVASDHRGQVVDRIKDFAQRYGECRIVVTCRVAVYDGWFADEFQQTLRVQDFDEHLIRRFLGGWPWPEGMADDTVEQLLGALRDTPQLMPLARNPLLLTMVAYLYSYVYAGTDQVLPHTRADFYKQVVDNLLMDRRRHSRFAFPLKKAVLQALALAAQDVPSGSHDRLTRPEGEVLQTVREVLRTQGREESLAEDVLREIVDRSGLLLAVDNGERYQFAHLTLQEYAAARALAADPEGLLRRYRADPTAWREAVRLWCGVDARDCTGVVRAVYAEDALLAFQCLADALVVEEGLAEEIVGHFCGRLGAGSDAAVTAAFGLVAADRRPRGVRVFEFLREAARAAGLPLRAAAACQALAATNLPRAAEALAEVPGFAAERALASMGDIAVPVLKRLAAEGRLTAASGLSLIRTPKAALALNELLWSTQDAKLLRRFARLVGILINDPQIEEELRKVRVEPGAGDWLRWVWRPFARGADDGLAAIAGRIAWVLRTYPGPVVSAGMPAPDPRIMAALSVVAYSGENRQPHENTYQSPPMSERLFRALRSTDLTAPVLRDALLADDVEEAVLLDGYLELLRAVSPPPQREAYLAALPVRLRFGAVVCLALEGPAPEEVWAPTDGEDTERALRRHRSTLWRWLARTGCLLLPGAAVVYGAAASVLLSPVHGLFMAGGIPLLAAGVLVLWSLKERRAVDLGVRTHPVRTLLLPELHRYTAGRAQR